MVRQADPPGAERLARRSTRVVVLGCCVLAFGATLLATAHGPGMSPDSVEYVSVARHLSHGQGLVGYDGSVMTDYPPGFPALLATGNVLGIDATTMARVINAVASGLLVGLGFILLRRHVRSPAVVLATTAALAVSPVLLRISELALTEPLYAVVVLVELLVLERFVESDPPDDRRLGVLAAVLVWTGFLLRYAGLSLLLAAVALVLVAAYRRGRRAIVETGVFAAVALIAPIAWIIRNLAIGAGPFGPVGQDASTRTAASNVRQVGDTLSNWILPGAVPFPIRLAVLLAATIGAIGLSWRWSRGKTFVESRRVETPKMPGTHTLLPILLYVGVYVSYLVAVASLTSIEVLDERILFPAFVPLVVLVAWTVDLMFAQPGLTSGRAFKATVTLGFGVWLLWPLATFAQTTYDSARDGRGYASTGWKRSPLLHEVEQLPSSARVFSNVADGVYFSTKRETQYSPTRGDALRDSPLARAAGCSDTVFLAWFTKSSTPRPSLLTPSEIRPELLLDEVRQASDGTLYRVRVPEPVNRGACPSSP